MTSIPHPDEVPKLPQTIFNTERPVREDQTIATAREEMNRLRGKLFAMLESWGLPDKQESACKQLIRERTYEAQGRIEAALRKVD